jgi:excisionase family DNA binding protein
MLPVRLNEPTLVDPPKDTPPVLTLTQAAAYLRVSKTHLSNAIKGKIPGIARLRCAAVGRRFLIRREWADAWLELVAGER